MSNQIYRVWFKGIDGENHCVDQTKGVWFVKEGFWVTENYELAASFDDDYMWIPPHRVIAMTKVGRTEEE